MRKVETILTKNYITCGLQGRTGNIMFQIAHAYVKALKYNRQFVAPSNEVPYHHLEHNLLRKIDFLIPRCDTATNAKVIRSPFPYTELVPAEDQPTLYYGWFQSEKFFENYTEVIRDLFSPTKDFLNKCLIDYPFLKDNVVAAINVRRGDYLLQPRRHPVVSMSYINEAYKFLPKHDILLVVSDDIQWCKENIKLPNVIFSENYVDQNALWLLSLCDHFIISNSSFSWWGAWLSRTDKKVVIAPSTWFGPDVTEHDPKDVWCNGWIKIPTYWKDGVIELKV